VICKFLFFELFAFLRSVEVKEKKATSEPEISAEQTNNIRIKTILKTNV
jgi:hypothetical protein